MAPSPDTFTPTPPTVEHSGEMAFAEDASKEAVHAAKNAAQATEAARQAQLAEAIAQTAAQTKAALIEGLKEVFGEGDSITDDGQMVVLVRRIPILCTNVESMHKAIEKIQGDIGWATKVVIGAVILALLKVIFIP